MIINSLDVKLPNTDRFFDDWPEILDKVPDIVKQRFVETEKARFVDGSLVLIEKDRATATIEHVNGFGDFEGKLLKNVIEHATHWKFEKDFLRFEGQGIKGVIAHA